MFVNESLSFFESNRMYRVIKFENIISQCDVLKSLGKLKSPTFIFIIMDYRMS